MSSSASSPSLSPSPPHSPAASYHGPPNLERLVTHFVAAKRSLNSTSHVYRANELVTSSRSLIEEIASLNAKNAFGRKGLDEQVDTLDAIRDAIVDDGDRVSEEFQFNLAELDKAHSRLEKTLSILRKTVVAAQAKHLANVPVSHEENQSDVSVSEDANRQDAQRTLYDFVDDATHETLLQSLRDLIDNYHSARGDLDDDLASFDTTLKSMANLLSGKIDGSSSLPPDKPTIYDEPPPTIPDLFHTMESHATQMASLLGNLIDHHDKCVDALKHTDGGGEAARIAIQSEELTKHPPPGIEESLYGKTDADPISEEERAEMLGIIECDAPQVEDVVIELKDYASELEESYSQLMKEVNEARRRNRVLKDVLKTMKVVRAAIPGHLDAASRFREIWKDIQVEMQDKTKEVVGLSVFYEQFYSGYGKLRREVERREASKVQMRKIAEKARRELAKLYEADAVARRDFMEDVSEYVPSDLGAWHGLQEAAPRWDVVQLEEQQDVRLHDG